MSASARQLRKVVTLQKPRIQRIGPHQLHPSGSCKVSLSSGVHPPDTLMVPQVESRGVPPPSGRAQLCSRVCLLAPGLSPDQPCMLLSAGVLAQGGPFRLGSPIDLCSWLGFKSTISYQPEGDCTRLLYPTQRRSIFPKALGGYLIRVLPQLPLARQPHLFHQVFAFKHYGF